VWILMLLLFPLTNRLRLRVGDLLAGTLVVLAPKAVLLGDQSAGTAVELASHRGASAAAGAASAPAPYEFTDKQLDVYGIYELQVLEDVLRKAADGQMHDLLALDTVAEKIKAKLAWDGGHGRVDPDRFLREFYAALRARLEHRMLLGERKEDKYSR